MAKLSNILVAGILCVIACVRPAIGASVGEEAPYFRVVSGSNEILTSDMIRGKIAVVFYETKDTIERNRPLKKELNAFYAKMPRAEQNEIIKVAVIRCSAFMPIIWRKNLREHSKKEGITIYGDWEGSMERDYGMKADESNFLIIDKTGIVRMSSAGIIPVNDFHAIEDLIDDLL